MSIKVIADNKKARFNYEILEKVEAGLVLQGSEVKSIRAGKASLVDGYCSFKGTSGMLFSVHISPYKDGGYANHEPTRPRKLLMHKREITRWIGKIKTKGLTVVPLKLFINNKGLIKCELALARGKKIHDKRETLKKKTVDRETKMAIKNRRMG
ncbi:MAG: SsrA-binding protein SmpB [Acidobacteriota bacterium]|nr:SsrA-binding protein SmpB [Acidobacteriota bacterium]